MWLSKPRNTACDAELDPVHTRVQTARQTVTDAASRRLQLLCPGGMAWRPSVGDSLVVLKDLALGSEAPCPVPLEPGECCLFSQGAYIRLTADGRIELYGELFLNGQAMEV